MNSYNVFNWDGMEAPTVEETFQQYRERRNAITPELPIDHTMCRSEIQLVLERGGLMGRWDARDKYVASKAFAIPCREAIEAIRGIERMVMAPVIDPMAGTGYWAWCLGQSGIPAIAYDIRGGETEPIWAGGAGWSAGQ